MVDVIRHRLQRDAQGLRSAAAPLPSGHQHPGIEHGTDDGVACNQLAKLIVGELPVVRHEGAAVRVAGPDRPVEMIKGLPEAVVAEVGDVEDDAQPLHLPEELAAP